MRTLQLKDALASPGATFEQRYGTEVATRFSDSRTEYNHVREAVGLTDFSFLQSYRIPEEKAIDFLDNALAGNVAKTRFGRILHTFLADKEGKLVADCYVANNDEEFVLLCESVVDDAAVDAMLNEAGAAEAECEKLTDSHVVLSFDGCKAWEVAKELFGPDVLGLPYLSIEMYSFEGENIRLFRAGKTSEFGYLLMAPRSIAQALLDKLKDLTEKAGGGLCGVDIHNDLRLEGRFFNIHAEGLAVTDPLALGLQWMIDFDKDEFLGSAPIFARRSEGLTRKIIGVRTSSADQELRPGAEIFAESGKAADVVTSCFSPILDRSVGLALFPVDIAYAGLRFHLGSPNGAPIDTVSMPPIMPKSLTVKLDEM